MLGLTQPNQDLKNKYRINESTFATEYIGPLEAVHRIRLSNVVLAANPNWTSSGHLRGCSIANNMRSLHKQ
eukprot:scaffold3769_cov164-Skeletonema_dohrnii-CCMP3373.AAC.1